MHLKSLKGLSFIFSCWSSLRCSMCICVRTFHQWSCAIRPGTLLTNSCQEDQALPSTQGKCSQRALKQSYQIISGTSCQQCPAAKLLHKLLYTLTPYSSYTPWSHPGILMHEGNHSNCLWYSQDDTGLLWNACHITQNSNKPSCLLILYKLEIQTQFANSHNKIFSDFESVSTYYLALSILFVLEFP